MVIMVRARAIAIRRRMTKDYGNSNNYVYMTGLFIARSRERGKNVI